MRVFGFIWRIFERLIKVVQILFFLLVVGFLVAVFSGMQGIAVRVPDSAALVIAPGGQLVEQAAGEALDRALRQARDPGAGQVVVRDVVRSLRMAIDDDRIQAVVLLPQGPLAGGLSKQQAIAAALQEVRAAGKPVIAMADNYDQSQYYLAAHADEVYMHDFGIVLFEGFGYYKAYFADAIEKLMVDINIFRVGEFKSFVEPFERNDMSPEDRKSSARWLGMLWSTYLDDVSRARDLEPAALDSYVNDYITALTAANGDAGQAAVNAGLVDRLMGHHEFRRYMVDRVGAASNAGNDYAQIDYQSYLAAMDFERSRRGKKSGKNVAVIVAAGEIVDGEASPGTVGSATMAGLIRQAAADDSVAAVVLQVDSPGGSMFASEVVLDELHMLRQQGKPLIASMSSVAASGGYYIALAADEIWASASTVSGSIGVGALFPTFQRSLGALGITIDGIGTTGLSGQFSGVQSISDDTRRLLDVSVQSAYDIFIERVATGRDMDSKRVDELARGQVWVGADALELGLVDSLGTIDDALQSAARRAGLADGTWDVLYIERKPSFAEQLLLQYAQLLGIVLGVGDSGKVRGLEGLSRLLGILEPVALLGGQWNDPRGLYYHCMCVAP